MPQQNSTEKQKYYADQTDNFLFQGMTVASFPSKSTTHHSAL